MLRRNIVAGGFAAALAVSASAALADGIPEPAQIVKDGYRINDAHRALDPSSREPARAHRVHDRPTYDLHRHHHVRAAYRTQDRHYGLQTRRHHFVAGVSAYGLPGPVNVATVTYRTAVYRSPAYASVSYGYPPYAYVYSLTPGPIYNKPCFC